MEAHSGSGRDATFTQTPVTAHNIPRTNAPGITGRRPRGGKGGYGEKKWLILAKKYSGCPLTTSDNYDSLIIRLAEANK